MHYKNAVFLPFSTLIGSKNFYDFCVRHYILEQFIFQVILKKYGMVDGAYVCRSLSRTKVNKGNSSSVLPLVVRGPSWA